MSTIITPDEQSPRIVSASWGRIEVEGLGLFKDVKCFPGGSRAWDWNETGTRHVPGIQPADAQELIDRGAEAIVLSRGVLLVLQVPERTVEWLKERGIEVHVGQTDEAIKLYNRLREMKRVAGLFHSTC